jgi:ENTS family enterobactin (siderophore) exporter
MHRPALLIDLSLLKTHPPFRAVFLARFISMLALGMLTVALPIQINQLTHSPALVGLAITLAGAGMLIGLLSGGVLADRMERKRLILFARSTCGLGFVGLVINSLLPAPSLMVIYGLALWDGFFGAIGVTALLAATPALVGRENLMQAGAISMLTVRFGAILSPAVAGLILAQGGLAWNYGIAAAGTFLTLLPLLKLPILPAPPQSIQHPVQSLLDGFGFIIRQPLIAMITLIGALVMCATAIRVLYPAFAGDWQISTEQMGLLYAAIPCGAALSALMSGRLHQVQKPGLWLLGSAILAFACIALLGYAHQHVWAMIDLVCFGYFSGINALLQYALIQQLTPDHLLGRINSVWTAQNVTGDAIGAAILGSLGSWISPAATAVVFGTGAAGLGIALLLVMPSLRRYRESQAQAA